MLFPRIFLFSIPFFVSLSFFILFQQFYFEMLMVQHNSEFFYSISSFIYFYFLFWCDFNLFFAKKDGMRVLLHYGLNFHIMDFFLLKWSGMNISGCILTAYMVFSISIIVVFDLTQSPPKKLLKAKEQIHDWKTLFVIPS